MSKVGFVLCVCTGDCPGFATMNVWDLINQVRLALPVEWAIVHPQLCEIDGDRFVQNLIQLIKENQIKYFIAGCSPNMQRKLIGHHFKEVGMDFCGDCVEFCAHGVYKMEEGKLIVENPKNCVVFCQACMRMCPHDAMIFQSKKDVLSQIKKIKAELKKNQ